ncbi:hypothetical protein R6Q59_018782 [Mikania micrantha]
MSPTSCIRFFVLMSPPQGLFLPLQSPLSRLTSTSPVSGFPSSQSTLQSPLCDTSAPLSVFNNSYSARPRSLSKHKATHPQLASTSGTGVQHPQTYLISISKLAHVSESAVISHKDYG